MELKQFVSKTIADIVDAVANSNDSLPHEVRLDTNKTDRTIEFDVAVSVEEKEGVEGKAGIKVLGIVDGGGSLSKEQKNASVSRVRFGVYVNPLSKQRDRQLQVEANELNNRPNFY